MKTKGHELFLGRRKPMDLNISMFPNSLEIYWAKELMKVTEFLEVLNMERFIIPRFLDGV